MKLLILTQTVDSADPNLGAFYRWYEELAVRCETLTIVALRTGEHALPPNVRVISAGKERGWGRWRRRLAFVAHGCREALRSDTVFSHMIPEYVLTVGLFARLCGRRVYLWYAHGSVTVALRLALAIVTRAFTSSTQGLRIDSTKVMVVGQAIDTHLFSLLPPRAAHRPMRLITTGRISQVKRIDLMIEALTHLPGATLSIVGEPITALDQAYEHDLRAQVSARGLAERIFFVGARTYKEMPTLLAQHDLFLNLSQTGSLDKAVLEAMSIGISVLTSNPAFSSIVPQESYLADPTPEAIARAADARASESLPDVSLRETVVSRHSLSMTLAAIVGEMQRRAK